MKLDECESLLDWGNQILRTGLREHKGFPKVGSDMMDKFSFELGFIDWSCFSLYHLCYVAFDYVVRGRWEKEERVVGLPSNTTSEFVFFSGVSLD